MPNGAVVAPPLDPLAVPACAAAAKPELLERIGEVTAAVAIAVCAGVEEFQAGGLAPATRMQVGDLFVRLYQLQQDTLGELDFDATARREGKRVLRMRHGAVLQQHLGKLHLDAVLDEIISWPLDVLAKVTACERAPAN